MHTLFSLAGILWLCLVLSLEATKNPQFDADDALSGGAPVAPQTFHGKKKSLTPWPSYASKVASKARTSSRKKAKSQKKRLPAQVRKSARNYALIKRGQGARRVCTSYRSLGNLEKTNIALGALRLTHDPASGDTTPLWASQVHHSKANLSWVTGLFSAVKNFDTVGDVINDAGFFLQELQKSNLSKAGGALHSYTQEFNKAFEPLRDGFEAWQTGQSSRKQDIIFKNGRPATPLPALDNFLGTVWHAEIRVLADMLRAFTKDNAGDVAGMLPSSAASAVNPALELFVYSSFEQCPRCSLLFPKLNDFLTEQYGLACRVQFAFDKARGASDKYRAVNDAGDANMKAAIQVHKYNADPYHVFWTYGKQERQQRPTNANKKHKSSSSKRTRGFKGAAHRARPKAPRHQLPKPANDKKAAPPPKKRR